jgi:hypothetical protein
VQTHQFHLLLLLQAAVQAAQPVVQAVDQIQVAQSVLAR